MEQEPDEPLPGSRQRMKKHWIIQCAGAGEEDEAHLRLLLRSARKQVEEEWAWGEEAEADLLLLGRQEPIGDEATRRLSEPGVASAQVIDANEAQPAGLVLRKPFHSDALAALLKAAAHAVAEQDAQPAAPTAEPAAEPPATTPAPAASAEDNATHSLLHYLPKRVLGGPARIALPDMAVLTIDPESRLFWAEGTLPSLEAYVREPLRFGDWQRLSADELEQARGGVAARPFACLVWMESFLTSKGVLSRRLDPEGAYSLTRRLELANDYPRALRISAQMTHPRKLDAVARTSGVDIAEVFDVVNAYDAIGYLERPRKS